MSAPFKTIGVIGGGQLGRMLALAGYPLGLRCVLLDPAPDSPAGQVADVITAPLDDPAALEQLAAAADVVTIEIENVSVQRLEWLQGIVPVHPPPAAVAAAQDRLLEKQLFRSLGIPTAPFVAVDSASDLEPAARALGWPVVLKLRRLGYDGRGQRIVRDAEALAAAWRELGERPCIAEGWVRFERELSLVAVRGADGALAFYPLAENVHRDGILRTTVAPYADGALQRSAERYLAAILERFDYRGVLTVEFFHTGDRLVANEMAPRVHNSGHWTIEGAETSQFANHLRAVAGWPLGSTAPRGHAAMINLLGRVPPPERLLAVPGAHLHAYGKSPRANRKVGHCTLVDADRDRLLARFRALQALVEAET
ncbi:MAG TPA: 5-(carboxyamino)imidazole ribonucleotide synthase [Gammaproteobacteria bacterium]